MNGNEDIPTIYTKTNRLPYSTARVRVLDDGLWIEFQGKTTESEFVNFNDEPEFAGIFQHGAWDVSLIDALVNDSPGIHL